MKWWNKEVTYGILLKFMITLNVVILIFCLRFAYIGDIIDKEQQKYYNHLEEYVQQQKELIRNYEKLFLRLK